jgi:hypothetical protein
MPTFPGISRLGYKLTELQIIFISKLTKSSCNNFKNYNFLQAQTLKIRVIRWAELKVERRLLSLIVSSKQQLPPPPASQPAVFLTLFFSPYKTPAA